MEVGFINVTPVTTEAQKKMLLRAALLDNHCPVYPTHLVERGSEIVGSLSVCAMPIVAVWLHTKKLNDRSALEVINIARNIGRYASGGKPLMTFSPEGSAVHQHMPALGFRPHITTTVFIEKEYQ